MPSAFIHSLWIVVALNNSSDSTPHDNSRPQNMRTILDGIPIAVFILDSNLGTLYANPAARELVKLETIKLTGHLSFLSFLSPEYRSAVKDFLNSPPATHKKYTFRTYFYANGIRLPVELTVTTTNDPEQGLLIYACDMSRSKKPSDYPMDKEDLFRVIVESSNVAGILIVDDQYRFIYANAKFARMLGTSQQKMIGHDFREWLHPDDVGMVAGRYAARQEGLSVPPVYEFRIIRENDRQVRILRIHSTVLVGMDGNVYSVAIAIDVTDEVRSRQMLEESELKYRVLIETMTSGLSVDTPDAKIKLVNSALYRMLGYANESELVGQPIIKILEGWTTETVKETMLRRKAGVVEQYEANLITKSGDLIPVIVSATPLYNRDGQYAGSLAVFTDVSDLKEADSEIRFLLDLLLHDVGNQLQLVLAGTDLLGFAKSNEEQVTASTYIRDGVDRCLDIISKVRRAEATKIEPPRPMNLIEIIRQECSLLERQLNVLPIIEDLPASQIVRADSALGHLLRNILENAVKHNPRPDKKIWIHSTTSSAWFDLCIADNGPGLSDSKKNDLFNPQRRYGGVGLHLVQKIARKYGCRLIVRDRVEGVPEEGLEVCIQFPRVYIE
ncbi:MAG: PAS domain S-box protein [Candidatus Thorarchaeota archaeon]